MVRGDSAKQATYSSYTYRAPLHEGAVFHYVLVFLVIATLAVGIVALANTYQLKKAIIPTTISLNDFLKKLTSHDEMKAYVGVAPLNLIQINNNNFANLQAQINGMDLSFVGNFIVQYTDRIVVYDYANDKVRGVVSLQQPQQAQLPNDFFTKLNKHPEMQGLQNQQPIGGQLDQASLNTLRQQFPEVYANAKTGDFLLRYQTKLIIYDYSQNKIVNSVNLT